MNTPVLNQWHKRLEQVRGKTVEQIIAFGAVCHAFQQDCERVSGGSTYSTKMEEWFGISQSTASHWAIIGANRKKLSGTATNLPPSIDSIYLACPLPVKVIREKVTKTSTRKEVREVKKKNTKTKPRKVKQVKYKPDPLFTALTVCKELAKKESTQSILMTMRKQFDSGTGFDEAFKTELVWFRDWIDRLIVGIEPMIVTCSTVRKPS